MRRLGWGLIAGTTVLLAGCSPGSQTPASSSQPSSLTLTTTSLPAGTAGSAYSSLVAASGGTTPYTYSAASLPNGLSINSATGAITGTPAQSSVGTASVTIKVTDSTKPSAQSAASNLTLTISGGPALTLTTTTLPNATLNTAYSATLAATGGVTPYTFTLANGTSLPAGLTLSSAGAISGTPTKAGSTSFSVQVVDSSTPTPLSQTGNLSITVNSSAGPACGNMSTGNGASLNGYVPFPASNLWNTTIASAAVDPNSAAIISALTGSNLHPDFSNVVDGNYGIPYVVVDSNATPGVPVTMTTYPSESDITLYPIPITAPIEGFPSTCTTTGDNHLIVIDKTQCWIYETWQTQQCNGAWSAANGAIWDLTGTEHRPYGWTSADAAGLPIFPGLVRYDEVAAGAINHAIRMTVAQTKSDAHGGLFVAPATHAAGNSSTTSNIMGMRLRLKASFDIAGFSAANQVILKAMQNYGLIVADNGSNMFFQGAPDARWDDNDLDALKAIDASNFDVVQMGTQYDDATAPTGAVPTISSFTASQTTVTAGTPVTLTWTVANDSYDFIDVLGPVRGGTQTVTPTATTTYTLNSTNQYGRSTMAVTVTVQ
jgi:Putative Ig domain